MAKTKSYVNKEGVADDVINSAARKNLNAAANSKNPITTLTELSHEPLLGSFRKRVGKRASTKNGEANVTENARPPSRLCHMGRCVPAAVPPKPPRNGATHAKLIMVKVRAMNMVPIAPPWPSLEEVN